MKRNYECMVLLDNREVRNGWQQLKDQVAGLFQKHGAEIKTARRWDERPLAYPIKGHTRATYLHMAAIADTDQVAAVRRDLQFADAVLRSLILQVEEFPTELHEPEEHFDETAVPLGDEPVAEVEAGEEGAEGESSEGSEASAEGGDAAGDAAGEATGDATGEDNAEGTETKETTEGAEPAQATAATTGEGKDTEKESN